MLSNDCKFILQSITVLGTTTLTGYLNEYLLNVSAYKKSLVLVYLQLFTNSFVALLYFSLGLFLIVLY
jgi:hypothetical protein